MTKKSPNKGSYDNRYVRNVLGGMNKIHSMLTRVGKDRKTARDVSLIESSDLFDKDWYLSNNPDVLQSKVDPVLHYLYYGGFEGRDPSPQFSSLWYLNTYDDVRKAKINPLLHYLKHGQSENRAISSTQDALTIQILEPYREANSEHLNMVSGVVAELNGRSLRGIFVVTSAFVFDEFFNQRVINLSKFLGNQGWGVIYIAWRWNEKEEIPSIGEEVYNNVFQIPVDIFLQSIDTFTQVQCSQKYFVVEFPYPGFFLSGLRLRRHGFKLVYEIIDEWQEFHKVGQAIWFKESLEKAFVINANLVTAVSPPLRQKFSTLRQDIHLSPNGYTPALLGKVNHNIAYKKHVQKEEMHLGYFGHLTESWFDWDFLFKFLGLSQKLDFKVFVHLIGYGETNLQERIAGYSDQIKFYGKIHPSELHQHVINWDAAIIWFRSGKLSEAVDPIKIYEYLYFGLPTIVKGISHLKDFPLTKVVANEDEALNVLIDLHNNGIKRLLESREESLAAEQMLINSTWEQRFIHLLELLEKKNIMVF